MPTYDYYSQETDEYKEIFHGMNEEPEVLDSKGNLMKRVILPGHGGYTMKKDSTRNKSWASRYGGKKRKSDHTPTPEESATYKARHDFAQTEHESKSKSDPYYQYRD